MKRGRPKIDEEEKRTRIVSVHLNEEECEKLDFLCKKAGVSKSCLLRATINKGYENYISYKEVE